MREKYQKEKSRVTDLESQLAVSRKDLSKAQLRADSEARAMGLAQEEVEDLSRALRKAKSEIRDLEQVLEDTRAQQQVKV